MRLSFFVKKMLTIIALFFSVHLAASDLSINGFGSIHAGKSLLEEDKAIESYRDYQDLSYDPGTKFGLNFRSELNNNYSFNMQAMASGDSGMKSETAPSPTWNLSIDWAFLSYEADQGSFAKIGRQLVPATVVAEYFDVGYMQPWRQLPRAMLSGLLGMKSMNGLLLGHKFDLNNLSLAFEIFSSQEKYSRGAGLYLVNAKEINGGSITLDGDNFRARIYHHLSNLDLTLTLPNGDTPTFKANKTSMSTASFRFEDFGLLLYAEHSKIKSENADKFGAEEIFKETKNSYATVGYRYRDIMPHYTYAISDIALVPNNVLTGKIKSTYIGLNYYLPVTAVIKLEHVTHTPEEGKGKGFLSEEEKAQYATAGIDFLF